MFQSFQMGQPYIRNLIPNEIEVIHVLMTWCKAAAIAAVTISTGARCADGVCRVQSSTL